MSNELLERKDKRTVSKLPLKYKLIVGGCIAIAFVLIVFICASALSRQLNQRVEEQWQEKLTESQNEIDLLHEQVDDLNGKIDTYKAVNLNVIKTQINEIGELATVEYLYTDAAKLTEAKKWFKTDMDIPLTTKCYVAQWNGVIKAGVDVKDITVEKDDEAKTITVHLPEARILSHEPDLDSFETVYQSDGLFNPITVDDIRSLDSVSKSAMDARAIENGLLEKAYESAKTIVSGIINSDPAAAEYYTINFV